MADSDDEQMHEVSDAELESMISSNTGDIESCLLYTSPSPRDS